ncbi:hypothetical protein ACO11K_000825 [Bacillus cytotoxicus]|nr:hypothetical protein [Bacillus cereus group sp. BfR-BA-01492]EMA6343043.1 hypothetical protein [Bacillus cytotoxicus]
MTLDGIHLNSDGALCVAEEYAFMIDQLLFDKKYYNHKNSVTFLNEKV